MMKSGLDLRQMVCLETAVPPAKQKGDNCVNFENNAESKMRISTVLKLGQEDYT